MSGVGFNINFEDLKRSPALVDFMQRFGAEWLAQAQRLTQVRTKSQTGEYARSFRVELLPGSPPKLRLANVSSHAIYVEENTERHDIAPTPKGRSSFTNPNRPGALRWFDPPGGGKGAAVFHPGPVTIPAHKGAHIIKDALIATGQELRA